MFSHEELNDRYIWIFAETRTGSSWLLRALCDLLNREPLHLFRARSTKELSLKQPHPAEKNNILYTHYFQALDVIPKYNKSLVIKTARKNKTEQILSWYLAMDTKINCVRKPDIHLYSSPAPRIVPLKSIVKFIEQYKYDWSLWDKYSSYFDHEVVYYETLLDTWQSKTLPVSLSMNMTDVDSTLKIPYDKRQIILNYDQIDEFVKQQVEQNNA